MAGSLSSHVVLNGGTCEAYGHHRHRRRTSGVAMSRCLSDWAIDHVVLERGRVGGWRSERWTPPASTPNWQSRLPDSDTRARTRMVT
jgi:hypothetical protein